MKVQKFTSGRFATGGWIVNALNTFQAITGAGEPDVHIRSTIVSRSTTFLHELHCTTNVEPRQPITDLLQTNPVSIPLLQTKT